MRPRLFTTLQNSHSLFTDDRTFIARKFGSSWKRLMFWETEREIAKHVWMHSYTQIYVHTYIYEYCSELDKSVHLIYDIWLNKLPKSLFEMGGEDWSSHTRNDSEPKPYPINHFLILKKFFPWPLLICFKRIELYIICLLCFFFNFFSYPLFCKLITVVASKLRWLACSYSGNKEVIEMVAKTSRKKKEII